MLESDGRGHAVIALFGKGGRGAVFVDGVDDALMMTICILYIWTFSIIFS